MAENDVTLDSLQIEIDASAKKANTAITALDTKLSKLSTAMDKITAGSGYSNLNALCGTLGRLSAIRIPQELAANLSSVSKAVAKFGNSSVSNATLNMPYITTALSDLSRTLNGLSLNFDVNSFSGLLNAISKFGGIKTSTAVVNIEQLSQKLVTMAQSLNGVKFTGDVQGLSELISAVSKLGGKNVTAAITNIPTLTQKLKEMLETLSKAPQVSNNVVSITNALALFATTTNKVSSASSLFNVNFGNFRNTVKKSVPTFTSLASAFGKFYATFFIFIRGFKKLWSAIESSMDYIETYNYFDAAMNQVTSQLTDDWEEAGYASADAYVEALKEGYKNQLTEITAKISGYQVNSDGSLTNLGTTSLGLDPDMYLNYQALYSQMSSSMGVASDYAVKLSDAMTRLGADLASVKNMDFEETYDKLASSLTGASRSADTFGVNIREANLQLTMEENGIEGSIESLTQNDKALLRTIELLDSTRYAWANLSDSLEQPSNQLRMLSSSFSNLGRTIGNIFLGAVSNVLPYVNALVIALQNLAQWVIDIFNIQIPTVTSQASSSLSDYLDDMDDGLDTATSSAKNLKQQLLGIDELNVISSDSSSGSSSSALADSTAIQNAFDEIYNEYIKKWDEAYAKVENAAQQHAKNLIGYFKRGEWEKLGSDIAGWLENGLKKINWSGVLSTSGNAGAAVAKFFNGLFSPSLFSELGTTIANGFNTAFTFGANFVKTFDWKNAGLSAANMVSSFAKTIDTATLAKGISGAIRGGLQMVSSFLKNTDFEEIGKKIGIFFKNLDWKGILSDFWDAVGAAINALAKTWKGMFEADPIGTLLGTSIVNSAIAFFATAKLVKIGSGFYSAFTGNSVLSLFIKAGTKAGTAAATATSEAMASSSAITTTTKAATSIGEQFCTIFTGVVIGYNLGNVISDAIYGEEWSLDNNWDTLADYIFGTYDRVVQENSLKLSKGVAEAVAQYNEGMYEVTQQLTITEESLGFGDKYTEAFGNFNYQLQTALYNFGELGIAINDYDAVKNVLNNDMYDLDFSTRTYLLTLSKQYDALSDSSKAMLEETYGIQQQTAVLNENQIAQIRAATGYTEIERTASASAVATETVAQYNARLTESYSALPSEMQKCIEKFEQTGEVYSGIKTKSEYVVEYNERVKSSFSALPSEMQKCIEKYEEATGQSTIYRDIAKEVSSVTEDAGSSATILYNDIDELSTSFGNVSDLTNKLTGTDLPNLNKQISEVTQAVKTYMPQLETAFSTSFENITANIDTFIDFYTNDFESLFTEKHLNDVLANVEPTFTTVFENIAKAAQKTFNKLVEAINNAMNVSWDEVKVGDETVAAAGKAQILKIDKISAYATGGLVTSGEVFMARENGQTEYVGNFGNTAAVANNDQIVNGISSGVRSAVSEVLVPILSEILGATEECASKETLSEDGVLNAVLNSAKRRNLVTGKAVFSY